MSREVKRVALDFDWPLKKVWEGFLLPEKLHGEPCKACAFTGQTHAAWWLQRLSQRLTMLADDIREQERARPLHPWLANDPYPAHHWEGEDDRTYVVDRPTADILSLVDGLIGTAGGGPFGYTGQDYRIFRAITKAAGVDERWGACPACNGAGSTEKYPGQTAEAEAWKPTPPPTGEGWQLWETVSDGSPISPVFPTARALAEFINPADPDSSLRWIEGPGWAPSGIATAEGFFTSSDIAEGRIDMSGEGNPRG